MQLRRNSCTAGMSAQRADGKVCHDRALSPTSYRRNITHGSDKIANRLKSRPQRGRAGGLIDRRLTTIRQQEGTFSKMDVRRATESDAEAIRAIYNREVLESTVTFDLLPRTLEQQRAYIADRSGGLIALVAEEAGTIAGFASLSFYRDRPAYRTSVENSVYTHRDYRGQGVADLLMASLVERATASGFHSIFARIADAQEPSLALHAKYGFELVGIEREVGRKFNRWLDVALMQLLLE